MNRIILCGIACLLCFVAIPQSDKSYTVVFKPGKQAQMISKYYLDYYDGGWKRDSAAFKDGKVIFKGNLSNPLVATLVMVMNKSDGGRFGEHIRFILEPATINIDATAGVDAARFSGTATQEEYNKWQSGLSPLYKESMAKWIKMSEYRGKKDKENELKMQDEIQEIGSRIRSFQETYMQQNSSSLVTALMLKEYVTPVWENLAQAEQIYANLDPKLKQLPDVQKFGEELKIALTLAPGKYYPDFNLPDQNGSMVNLSSYKGKYVLIDFWASWCGPCRQESPALVSAYQKYKDKGFDIFSISFDQDKSQWLKAVAADQYTWINVLDSTGMGPEGNLSGRFNIMAIPRNFLLDRNGKIIATNLRGEELERKLREVFGG